MRLTRRTIPHRAIEKLGARAERPPSMTIATETKSSTTRSTTSRHVGVVGLAVMGENLALNIERNGFPISVYNRTRMRTDEFMATRTNGVDVQPSYSVEAFVSSLAKPR